MKSNTVFGHLALQHAHPENWATEALGFILRTSPAASRAFTEFVRQVEPMLPSGLRFETQRGGSGQSIPDMKCLDNEGRLRVVVENKFWAGLTENQPVAYVGELRDGVAGLVLFVVPRARLQRVWDAVVARCSAKIPIGEVQTRTTITFADLGQGHYIAATSWTALLDALSTSASLAVETERLNDIAQLQGLCKSMDEEEFLPIHGGELTNVDMARRIVNFSDLAVEIAYKAESQGLCKRIKLAPYKYGLGTYIQIGEYRSWVGFDAFTWRRLGVSPISVTFWPPTPIEEICGKLNQFRTAESPRCFDMSTRSERWVAVPILLTPGVEKERIIEDAICQIKELRDKLGVQEPTAGPELAPTGESDAGIGYNLEGGPGE